MKIAVINGPNINMLGIREPELYGGENYETLCAMLRAAAQREGIELELFQSNHEGAIVDEIQSLCGRADGIIINPAAYTHTSVAILDALKAVGLPAVEVHITDPDTREEFRRVSYVRPACIATVKGEGLRGYIHALELLAQYLRRNV